MRIRFEKYSDTSPDGKEIVGYLSHDADGMHIIPKGPDFVTMVKSMQRQTYMTSIGKVKLADGLKFLSVLPEIYHTAYMSAVREDDNSIS